MVSPVGNEPSVALPPNERVLGRMIVLTALIETLNEAVPPDPEVVEGGEVHGTLTEFENVS
jgi:hypothetical protein